jgi:hypothetical protein
MSSVRWMVLRDSFPFAEPSELGVVTAPDKTSAEQLGSEQFGGRVLVRSIMSIEAAKYERVGNGAIHCTLGDVDPRRRRTMFADALKRSKQTREQWAASVGRSAKYVRDVLDGTLRSETLMLRIQAFIEHERGFVVSPPKKKHQPKDRQYTRRKGVIAEEREEELQRAFAGVST